MPLKYLIFELHITTVQKSYAENSGEFDIPITATYNSDGISPGKKLCLFDLCSEGGVSVPDYCFSFGRQVLYLRKRMDDSL